MEIINTTFEVLNGWKEIAKHLGMSVRSAQRYERLAGLTIRRPTFRNKGAVLATKAELDAWLKAIPLKDTFSLKSVPPQHCTVTLEAFKTGMAEHRRLQEEMARERQQLHTAVELLRATLAVVQDEAVGKSERQSRRVLPVSGKIM
jgi:hypothetical protein